VQFNVHFEIQGYVVFGRLLWKICKLEIYVQSETSCAYFYIGFISYDTELFKGVSLLIKNEYFVVVPNVFM